MTSRLNGEIGNCHLDDGIIVLSSEVNREILLEYNIPIPPSHVDLSQYQLIREVYAGRVSHPVLDLK